MPFWTGAGTSWGGELKSAVTAARNVFLYALAHGKGRKGETFPSTAAAVDFYYALATAGGRDAFLEHLTFFFEGDGGAGVYPVGPSGFLYQIRFYQSDQGWHQATSNALQFFGFGRLIISGRPEPVLSETCFEKNKKVYDSKARETDVRQLATALYQCYADAGAAEFAKARILSIMINHFTPNQIARDEFLAIRA